MAPIVSVSPPASSGRGDREGAVNKYSRRQPRRRSSLPTGLLEPAVIARWGCGLPLVPIANRPRVLHVSRGCGPPACARSPSWATVRRAQSRVGGGPRQRGPRGPILDHVDRQALDAPAVAVQPADAVLTAPLQDLLGEVASAGSTAPSCGSPGSPRPSAPAAPGRRAAHVGACLLGARRPRASAPRSTTPPPRSTRSPRRPDRLVRARARGRGPRLPRVLRRGRRPACGRTASRSRASVLDRTRPGRHRDPSPALIHPTAVVRSTLVRGPAVIGPGVRLNDVYVGPYTSIGENVTIEGAEIETHCSGRGRSALARCAPDDEHHRSPGSARPRFPSPPRHARRGGGRRRGGAS